MDDYETLLDGLDGVHDSVKSFRTHVDTQHSSVLERVESLEASVSTGGPIGRKAPKSIFREIAEDPAWKKVTSGGQRETGAIAREASVKTILTSLQDSIASPAAGYDVMLTRADRFGNDPRLPLTLLSALPSIPMTQGNTLEFPRLTSQPEGDYQPGESGTKTSAGIASTMVSFPIATIADWIQCSTQVIDDVPVLQGQIERLLTYGVRKKCEIELVAGDGVGRNIEGLETAATAFSHTAGFQPVDRIGEAAASLSASGWVPDLCVLHPSDWFSIASERVIDANPSPSVKQGYVSAGGWATPANAPIWSLRRVTTPSLTEGTALVLDSAQVAILDRMQAAIIATRAGHTNVIANLITVVAEIRLGLAIWSPAAVLSVDLS